MRRVDVLGGALGDGGELGPARRVEHRPRRGGGHPLAPDEHAGLLAQQVEGGGHAHAPGLLVRSRAEQRLDHAAVPGGGEGPFPVGQGEHRGQRARVDRAAGSRASAASQLDQDEDSEKATSAARFMASPHGIGMSGSELTPSTHICPRRRRLPRPWAIAAAAPLVSTTRSTPRSRVSR